MRTVVKATAARAGRMNWIPGGLDPLSVRVCEMAGDSRGRLPGVVLVGVAPKPANPGAKVSFETGQWIGESGAVLTWIGY